jgi:hypothetical protein
LKKYLVSGISPGNGGVGRLMRVLAPAYKKKGFKVICKRNNLSIRNILSKNNYLQVAVELIKRILSKIWFDVRCSFIRKAVVVFIHPQTAGYKNLFKLIGRNELSMYVMDCSFFCIMSYNTHPIEKNECLQCLGGLLPPDSLCQSFPIEINKNINIKYLNILQKRSKDILFLAQNYNQKKLLIEHFGSETNVDIVGMNTEELLKEKIHCNNTFNVVFHGTPIISKGLGYVIELANLLPNLSFLIPSDYGLTMKVLQAELLPKNVTCIDMSWESGLKEQVVCADLVLVPSLWSAPIEGALIKSAFYNDNVATVESKYGYESEFNGIKNHLKISNDVNNAAQCIGVFFKNFKRQEGKK